MTRRDRILSSSQLRTVAEEVSRESSIGSGFAYSQTTFYGSTGSKKYSPDIGNMAQVLAHLSDYLGWRPVGTYDCHGTGTWISVLLERPVTSQERIRLAAAGEQSS